MIGVLIIGHGNFGQSLLDSARSMLGAAPRLAQAVAIGAHDDPDRLLPRVQQCVRELDDGDGVLVLTDIFGATPCNIATRILASGRVEGVSGANLPMLLRVLTYRNVPLATLVEKARSGGAEGVIHMNTDRCSDAQR